MSHDAQGQSSQPDQGWGSGCGRGRSHGTARRPGGGESRCASPTWCPSQPRGGCTASQPEAGDRHDGQPERRAARRAALQRRAGLLRCCARARGRDARWRLHRQPPRIAVSSDGPHGLFVPGRRDRAPGGQPEPLATGSPEHEQRSVPGRRRALPGARGRHGEPDHHRGRDGGHPRRPADHDLTGGGRAGAVPGAPRPAARRRRDLHPQSHRPLRRCAGRRRPG